MAMLDNSEYYSVLCVVSEALDKECIMENEMMATVNVQVDGADLLALGDIMHFFLKYCRF